MTRTKSRSTKSIKVTAETKTGRNTRFKTNRGSRTRQKLVQEIRAGKHKGYHVRIINGVATPVSNPDASKGNNLN